MLTSKQSSQVPSEGEYKAATSILSATTMREACRHLLSCIGDVGSNNNNNNEAGSSSENNNKLDLVGIYKRVRDAADVVRRREAAVGKGGIGGGGGGGGGQLEPPSPAVSRSQGKMASQHHQPQPRGRPLAPSGVLHGKHPLSVGKRKGSLGSRLGVSAAGRSLMISAGASTGAGGSGGGPAQKRQRTGGVGGSGGGGGEGGDDAPPPSALSFLAALNKPGGAVGPPGAPPLHMAASAASSSSTSFPGARAGRSQPVPRSKPKKARPKEERASTTTPKGASAIKSERESTTSSAEKRKRKGRSGSSTVEDASANNNNSKVRSFEVGDDVLVIWNDGNRYAAIVKDVNAAEEINGCLLYDVEFDNGEIAENVKADDVVSPSDVEGEEDYEESD